VSLAGELTVMAKFVECFPKDIPRMQADKKASLSKTSNHVKADWSKPGALPNP
jgi:hypothetical protein